MKMGKVWLVGAGPGDLGLLTLKGADVIQKADLIVYDALVGEAILTSLPKDVEKISVGKRSGNHTMPQDQIDVLLAEKALEGLNVVRLKGGDPFLFGRGGEELELLVEKGIPYEVVPGVTSSIAVPAYNGIPVTHRDFTSSLHIITGHKRKGSDYDINFRALVETRGTLVFLMGIAQLPLICGGLLDAGMDPDKPAAVLSQGTTAGQNRIVATVGTLAEEVEKRGIETPAIIIVGDVAALADQFYWYEKLPLAGWRIIVTRPSGMISSMAARLRRLGGEVLEMPSIETVPLANQEKLRGALDEIDSYNWIVFTSPTGVRVFFDELIEYGKDIRSMAGLKVAAIGEGTRKELAARGLVCDMMPSVYDGETLGKELAEELSGGEKILLPRAALGNPELVEALEAAGAVVADVPTYDTVAADQDLIDEIKLFEAGKINCAVFTSASTVRGFVERTQGLDYSIVLAACIGKQTKAAADSYGMKTYMAEKATMDSLADLVVKMKADSV